MRTTRVTLLSLVAIAVMIAGVGCSLFEPPDSDNDGIPDDYDNCPNEAGPRSNNGCPEREEFTVDVWTDKNTYSAGQTIIIHFSTNRAANLTLKNHFKATGTTTTYFSDNFYDPGEYTYRAVSGGAAGQRQLELIGVLGSGQTVRDFATYDAGCPIVGAC